MSPPPFLLERPGVLKDGPDSKRLKLSDSEEDSDDDEGVQIEGVAVVKGDAKPAEDTAEALKKAAEARATMSLEKRQQDFKAMLLERGVSMFSHAAGERGKYGQPCCWREG